MEPKGGAHRDKESSGRALKESILTNIRELQKLPVNILIENRVTKYSTMGAWIEN